MWGKKTWQGGAFKAREGYQKLIKREPIRTNGGEIGKTTEWEHWGGGKIEKRKRVVGGKGLKVGPIGSFSLNEAKRLKIGHGPARNQNWVGGRQKKNKEAVIGEEKGARKKNPRERNTSKEARKLQYIPKTR